MSEVSEPLPIPNLERRISTSLLRLRIKSPFFATLAMFARFKASLDLPTAATDGRDVFYNPTSWRPSAMNTLTG